MPTLSTSFSIGSVEMDEKGRNYDEEDVGEGVDKLSDVRRDCVVIFAPVDG